MAALRKFDDYKELFDGLDFEFLKYESGNISRLDKVKLEMGDGKLLKWCEMYAEIPQLRKMIFIADNDNDNVCKHLKGKNGASYKNWGNNVYSLTLPIPEHRKNTPKISIEHLYTDAEIMTELELGGIKRRLYMGYEFDSYGIGNDYVCMIRSSCGEGKINIIESNVRSKEKGNDANMALSKKRFAEGVLSKKTPFDTFDFANFLPIFKVINDILNS